MKIAALSLLFCLSAAVAAPAFAEGSRREPRPVEELRPLAEAGDAEAQCELGWRLATGEGAERDLEAAVTLFRKAAEAGSASARRNLGVCLLRGEGLERNPEAAVAELSKAADLGDWRSAMMLHLLHEGQSGGPLDPVKAEKWRLRARELLEETVAKDDDDEAVAMFGKIGVALLRAAAERGEAEAQSGLGECHRLGRGVPQSDVQAFNWHFMAANQGDAFSQYMVACFFFHGDGIGRDEAQAFAWALKAAEQGDETAQYNVGRCYLDGTGVAENRETATEWLRRAADGGSREAAALLADLAAGRIPVRTGAGGVGVGFQVRRTWGR